MTYRGLRHTEGETSPSCTLEADSAAQFEDFGGFTIEGTHGMGSELGGNGNSAEVTAHGEDSVHIEYDVETECMTYSIEGGETQVSCTE